VHSDTLGLAQSVQRRDFERFFLALVIAAAARGLDASALFITPLVERTPSAQHSKFSRLCVALFGKPFMQRFAQRAQSTDGCENRRAFLLPGWHLSIRLWR
jgi:hypothetical protein